MRLLLLAGTNDSAQIAATLARESRLIATASLARAARSPVALGLPTRIGGWGSDAAFKEWLLTERVDAILDVTHPFAIRISDRAFRAASELGLGYLRFQRPQWLPGPDDRWTFLNDLGEVESKVPRGARLMIDTDGRGNDRLGHLDGRTVYCRLREPLPEVSARPAWHFIYGRGPFALDSEAYLYETLALDWIVLPNVGGVEESPKLDAARRLGIRIGIVRRPPQAEAPRAETVSEVMRWVRSRL